MSKNHGNHVTLCIMSLCNNPLPSNTMSLDMYYSNMMVYMIDIYHSTKLLYFMYSNNNKVLQ